MITIRSEHPADVAAREALLDTAYGSARFGKPSQRLRAGRAPALAFVAMERGRVVGTVRLWPVRAARRCCSARSRSRPTAAAAASARP